MRNLFIAALVLGTIGFLVILGYAIRTIFADFGIITGLLASACVAAWCIMIGHLVDQGSVIVLPPEPQNTPTRRGRK